VLGHALVQPLEEDWRDTLDRVARARGWPTSHDVASLAPRVAALSAAYNDAGRARATARDAGAARLAFSFPRDVPKGAAAIRELIATGALRFDSRLSVLDLGAGLGATTWGVARALAAAGATGTLDATLVDRDADALELARSIASLRDRAGTLEVRMVTRAQALDRLRELPRFDLVLAGQLLSELDVGMEEAERAALHAERLMGWLEHHTDAHGSLVVIEPALRDRTRHLHRVRDAVTAAGATVYAPCLHGAPCPALAQATDWCHEDLPIDLPSWLAPVARAAGLRREGLTFSYLVLRRDGARVLDAFAPGAAGASRLRVVSSPLPSKGKTEAFLCGEATGAGSPVSARVRATRLDRDAREGNEAWSRIARGDLVAIAPALELGAATAAPAATATRARVHAESTVVLLGDTKSR
jgi:ribosomal protein RSM22 (predicted rRNA methylase)